MARLIKANGIERAVFPKDGKKFTLKELQKYVGGYIEIHSLTDIYHMVMNEDGKLVGLPFNTKASILFGQEIVGDVLISSISELE